MINRLSDREKIFVFSGGALLLLLFLWLGVINPYRQGIGLAESHIASRKQQLEEVRRLQQEYFGLQRVLASAEKKLAGSTASGFSLFSYVEDATTRTGVRENLVSMRPQTPQVLGDYREESVEIRLERIGLEQLVRFLYVIESADAALQTKTLRIKPRFDNREQLDTVLVVSSLQRAT
jgi:general secretion pathway protein M